MIYSRVQSLLWHKVPVLVSQRAESNHGQTTAELIQNVIITRMLSEQFTMTERQGDLYTGSNTHNIQYSVLGVAGQ